jgi:hypothetical protein
MGLTDLRGAGDMGLNEFRDEAGKQAHKQPARASPLVLLFGIAGLMVILHVAHYVAGDEPHLLPTNGTDAYIGVLMPSAVLLFGGCAWICNYWFPSLVDKLWGFLGISWFRSLVDKLWEFVVRVWYGLGSLVAGIVGFISMSPILFGAGVLVWQIAHWLTSGEWRSVPTSDALTYVGIHYSRDVVWPNLVGVQKLFNFFLDMPLCLTSFFVLGYLSVLLNEWLYKNVYVALWPPTHRPRPPRPYDKQWWEAQQKGSG